MMIKDVKIIREQLIDVLKQHVGTLKIRVDKPSNFEVNGTIEAPQGKKIVQGIYFSSVVPKEKDVRFYFYPAYTHPTEFTNLSEQLTKFKKGKSCFHVKFLDDDLIKEIGQMVNKAIDVYRVDGLLE